MLDHLRVLDLCDERGLLCGQILADLGADVLQWVDPAVAAAPSSAWVAWTRNKRALTGTTAVAAAAALATLLDEADIVIESSDDGRIAALGCTVAEVQARWPRLVVVSISGFGRSGPKAGWPATDLTLMAAGGLLGLSGDAAGPLRLALPQAYAHAAADAAVGALVAARHAAATGQGQHVDAAAQQSLTLATLCRSLDAPLGSEPARRSMGGARIGPVEVRTLYRSRDGWVLVTAGIIPPMRAFMERLMAWAVEDGRFDAARVPPDWGAVAARLASGELDAAFWQAVESAIGGLVAARTNAELMEQAVARKLLLAPVFALADVLAGRQLAERGFVARDAVHGDAFPGPFARFSATPLPAGVPAGVREPAGAAGWRPRGAPPRPVPDPAQAPAAPGAGPLAGVRVLDLFWVVAGPGATRMLADFGATVVKVESSLRTDTFRNLPPYLGNIPGQDRAAGYQSTNAGKLNLCIDLACPAARGLVEDLVRWADVVTESFAPGVIARFGLGWDDVRRINPRAVMISSSLMGQTGPWRGYAGFGNVGAAVAGVHALAGRPGAAPCGAFGPYTDFVGVRFNAAAILAALDARDRSGHGQYIDMAQCEAALHFLAPAIVDWAAGRALPYGQGNADPAHFPHDVFRCSDGGVPDADPMAGWLAVAVDDRTWPAFAAVLGRPDWAGDPRLETVSGRRAGRGALDATLRAWAATRTAAAAEAELLAAGIAAHRVHDMPGLASDPQLHHRGHWQQVMHPELGPFAVEGARLRLSATPAAPPREAVTFHGHEQAVLGGLLGWSGAQVDAARAAGVLR